MLAHATTTRTTTTREIIHAIADEYRTTADYYDYLATVCDDDARCDMYLAEAARLYDAADMALDEITDLLGGDVDDTLPDALLWEDVAAALEDIARNYRVRAAATSGEYREFLLAAADDMDASAIQTRADMAEVLENAGL